MRVAVPQRAAPKAKPKAAKKQRMKRAVEPDGSGSDDDDDAGEDLAAELASLKADQDAILTGPRRRRATGAEFEDEGDDDGGGMPGMDGGGGGDDGGEVAEAGKGGRGTKGGAGSKKGRGKLSDDQKEDMARGLLERMALAAQEDKRARAEGRPAARKLFMLGDVRRCVKNSALHESLLEGVADDAAGGRATGSQTTILAVMHEWLRPLPGSRLPDLSVRTAVYSLLQQLPIEGYHLRSSKLGPVLVAMRKHPDETPANKVVLQRIVDAWMRAAIGRGSSVRSQMGAVLAAEREAHALAGVDADRAATYAIEMAGPGVFGGGATPSGGGVRSAEAETRDLLSGAAAAAPKAAAPQGATLLARKPVARGFTFMRRPESGMTGAGPGSAGGEAGGVVRPAAPDKDGMAARFKRTRQTLRRARTSKTASDHKVSIEGRGVT